MTDPARLVLLGDPVSHSLSPVFQNAALKHAGISLVYEAVRVESADLQRRLDALTRENAAGNITVPHKIAAYRFCERVTPLAARVGAVNTFWVEGGLLHGDNTDVEGFSRAATQLVGEAKEGARVVLFGAGGAAAAVLAAIEHWNGASALVVSRNPARSSSLVARFSDVARVESDPRRALAQATLVINATPLGLLDDHQPCDVNGIAGGAAVMDLVYRNGDTPWVRAAKTRGLRAIDGLSMLLEQGALSFSRWFGREPDRQVMQRSLQDRPQS